MRKGILVLIAVSFVFLSRSDAQLLKSVGAKLAYTSASQKYDYAHLSLDLDIKRRSGFNAGIYAEWLNLPVISVVTELDYVQRGRGLRVAVTTAESPDFAGWKTLEDRIDYISVPILVKATLPTAPLAPYLAAGPRLDFKIGAHEALSGGPSIYDNYKKTLWGATIGAGVELSTILPVKLLAEFRYNADFSDAYKTDLLTIKNNSFDLWLGVGF